MTDTAAQAEATATDHDVIVLGCGTAGSKAGATAQKLGARVLVVDSAEELGGLCILRGCMPTKTLLETAHRLHDIRDAERFGIRVGAPELDFTAHMERMRALVARFQRAKVGGIESAGYPLLREHARFVGPHAVEIGGVRHTAKAFVIATGSVVRPLSVPVAENTRVVTSDDLFLLKEPPKSAVVLGAGAVGLEFAQWLARIGAETTLAVRSPLLHRFDPEMGQELQAALEREMSVCTQCTLVAIEEGPEGLTRVRTRLKDGSESVRDVELVLNATGRIPNVEGLGLDALGLDPRQLGLNGGFQTATLPHVFVAGDTTGDKAILHEANLEGAIAGENAVRFARGEEPNVRYDERVPPVSVIFSDPPVATVGRSPLQCARDGIEHEAALKRFPQQGRGIVVGAEHGFLRLVAEPGGGAVLGCQIIGPRADDLIHIPATAMRLNATVKDLFGTPWYHPTLAEAFIEVCRTLAG